MEDAATYVLYRGDEIVDIGTAQEIADRRGVRADTIRFYGTESYRRRVKDSDDKLVAVRVE